jgi:hypothetical protein
MTWKLLTTGVLSILTVTALATSRFSLARKRRRAPETIMTPSEMVGLERGRPEGTSKNSSRQVAANLTR